MMGEDACSMCGQVRDWLGNCYACEAELTYAAYDDDPWQAAQAKERLRREQEERDAIDSIVASARKENTDG